MPRAECAWPATPESVRNARAFVAEQLEAWGATELLWVVTTVVSEMATNAVLHARTQFSVAIELEGPRLQVRVRDGAVAVPIRRRYENDASTGRGMALLEALTSDWGVDVTPDGKVVWCVVEAHPNFTSDRNEQDSADALVGHFADAESFAPPGRDPDAAGPQLAA